MVPVSYITRSNGQSTLCKQAVKAQARLQGSAGAYWKHLTEIRFRHKLASCYFLSSADNLCKQFGLRSGPSRSKLFDTLIVFLNFFLENFNFEKVSRRQQKHEKLPSMQRLLKKEKKNSYLGL